LTNVPDVQSVQTVKPAVAAYVPAEQSAQTDKPVDPAKVPDEQSAHIDTPVVPVYLPTAQFKQIDKPVVPAYVPTRQSAHTDSPAVPAYLPFSHKGQIVTPPLEYVPVEQFWQTVNVALIKVPGWHEVQIDAPAGEKLPLVQLTHPVAFGEPEYVPRRIRNIAANRES